MIMRLFRVNAKKGCAPELIEKFATSTADVVQNEQGNAGYFFGQGIEVDQDIVMFASFWENLDAIKNRFGENWQVSFLPEGYEELIDECSVEHIDVSMGWHVK